MTVDERRAFGNERIPFEALVAVEAEGEGPFECEAIDLSAGGLRARTAYLPALGRRITCRFDVAGVERRAEGRVVWKLEQTRGGEFGAAFDELDPAAREAIAGFCGVAPGPAPRASRSPVEKGDRVRLHIDGLGSPMRARVQEADAGELMVGSNLEFLRLGRPLSLEDVDKGKNVPAVIDEVGVRVDPGSHVPQLLVRLRCDDQGAPARSDAAESPPSPAVAHVPRAPFAAEAARAPAAAEAARVPATPETSRPLGAPEPSRPLGVPGAPRPDLIASLRAGEPRAAAPTAARAPSSPAVVDAPAPVGGPALGDGERAEASDEGRTRPIDAPASDAGEAAAGPGAPDGVAASAPADGAPLAARSARAAAVMAALRASVEQLGPRFGEAAGRARAVSERALGRLRKKEAITTGMRTTTEMPNVAAGAERRGLGAGRDATMEEQHEASEGAAAGERNKNVRRWAVLGGAGLAAALLATLALKTKPEAPPGAEGALAAEAAPAGEVALAATSGLARPVAAAGDAVTANVPLFGPTPLSTIEPVAVPPGAPVPSSFAAGSAPGIVPPPTAAAAVADGQGAATFGRGEVRRARTVRLQMDAPIGALRGNVSDGTLVVTVPGRHNIEPAAPLARRDARLASVKAVPVGDDTEVTLSFKGDVPPFLAKAAGRTLEIDLGDARRATASADDGDEPRGKRRHARRSHDAPSERHGAKSGHDAKRDGGGDKDDRRRPADARDVKGDRGDKRHDAEARDGKSDKRRDGDAKGDKRRDAESGADKRREAEPGGDKRRAEAGDKRRDGDAKGDKGDKGDKRHHDRPKRERDRDDEGDD